MKNSENLVVALAIFALLIGIGDYIVNLRANSSIAARLIVPCLFMTLGGCILYFLELLVPIMKPSIVIMMVGGLLIFGILNLQPSF